MSTSSAHPLGPVDQRLIGDNAVSAEHKLAWATDGFVTLRGVFDGERVARYNDIVARVRRELDDGKDEYGFGDRIGQLHQREPELLDIPSDPRLLDFLRWAFGEDPVLMGSLQFERGTQQEAHIDAIFFWPEPAYAMAGVWVALEDVHPEAGPLFYVPGSHKWPFHHSENVVETRPELAEERRRARSGSMPDVLGRIGAAWTEEFVAMESESGVPRVTPSLKAGDAVVWHSLLAHGGSPRMDHSLSRKSAVFHYLGSSARLYTFEQFMLFDRSELPAQQPQVLPRRRYGELEYMRFPQFVTYSGGAEHVHAID